MLIDQGLTHAVEQLVAFWRARRPQIEFQTDIEDARFPASVEETAFRIFQEGMSNAVRHGNPSIVELTARRTDDGTLRVVISDDGSGITATSTRGFGLVGIRERVALLNGSLAIESRRDAGTRLAVEIPLP